MFISNSSSQLDKQCTTPADKLMVQKPGSQNLKMFNENFNISEALTSLYAKASEASYITRHDRELVKLTLLQENLKEEEHRIINRLLYAIRRGWIKLVDDVQPTLAFDKSRRFLQGLNSVA
jgi:hypothetical protein